MSFPVVTVEDMVEAQFLLLNHLGINRLHAAVGASLGGMQSVMSAAMFPDRVGRSVTDRSCVFQCTGIYTYVEGLQCSGIYVKGFLLKGRSTKMDTMTLIKFLTLKI